MLHRWRVSSIWCFAVALASALFVGSCWCSIAFVAPKLKKEARATADNRRHKRQREREDGDGPGRVIEASVTVSVGGCDVDVGLLPCMEEFLCKETCAGLCVVERGGIAFNVHFQMVVRIWAMSLIAINKKDRDEPHFQKVDHNISVDDLNDGIELHSLYGADALKNKVCLTPVNVFDRSLMFWRFKLNHPVGNRFLDVLERMVRSGHYYSSSHWIIPYQGRGMSCSKLNALWKCMKFSLSVTEQDIRLIFVAKDMQSNVEPRSDWFNACWQDNIRATMDEGSDSVDVEATQEEDLAENEDNCPLARLHDVLSDISVQLQADNPAEQRSLRVKITRQFDELTFVLQNVTMDDLAMQIMMLEMHMQNLSKQVGLLKIQLNKLAALVQRLSLIISRITI
ncbi:hypothetical protein L7F22_040737 [Adiantum nelumboides]|nr:hypothetical protein [Adiantum nelumboides]